MSKLILLSKFLLGPSMQYVKFKLCEAINELLLQQFTERSKV